MPLFGLNPFLLPQEENMKKVLVLCVNALIRAESISTINKKKLLAECEDCVNALIRAESISTVPL